MRGRAGWVPTSHASRGPTRRGRAEHVATHDEGAGRGERRELRGVFLRVGPPSLEAIDVDVAERLLPALALAGGVAVERDHHVCGDLWHFFLLFERN